MRREEAREEGDGDCVSPGRRPASMTCMSRVSWREASSLREIRTSESLICLRDSRYNIHVHVPMFMENIVPVYTQTMYANFGFTCLLALPCRLVVTLLAECTCSSRRDNCDNRWTVFVLVCVVSDTSISTHG